MEKTDLKTRRMRSYFIQATVEILKAEGLRAVNVRSVAERAGYSYATLYNYFDDAKDLIFECVKIFLDECRDFVEHEVQANQRGLRAIKETVIAYTKYFVQYPGIFELFYLEKPSDLARKQPTIELIVNSLDQLCSEVWSYGITHGEFSESEAEQMAGQLQYTVLGLLMLYITKKHPATYEEFVKTRDQQLTYILGV